jgi:adenylate cyclase
MSERASEFEGYDPNWYSLLTGKHPHLRKWRGTFKLISPYLADRCRLCYAPFTGICAPIAKWLGRGPWNRNPHYCDQCEQYFREHRGGTEIDIAVVYADVRGSTQLASVMSPKDFSVLMERFYLSATKVLVDGDATIDKMTGDGVIGLFFPELGQGDYRLRAARSGLALLKAAGHGTRKGPWLPIGVGVHAGKAFVGSLGVEGGAYEFAALGETMNIGARLVVAAGEGEIVFSEAVWPQIESEVTAERAMLNLKGVDEPMPAYIRRDAPVT